MKPKIQVRLAEVRNSYRWEALCQHGKLLAVGAPIDDKRIAVDQAVRTFGTNARITIK